MIDALYHSMLGEIKLEAFRLVPKMRSRAKLENSSTASLKIEKHSRTLKKIGYITSNGLVESAQGLVPEIPG